MYGLVVAGGLLVIIVQVARGSSPLGILGAYQVAGETHYHFWPVVEWFWYQLGVLDLSLGVVPLAALIVLCAGLARAGQAGAGVPRRLRSPSRSG